MSRCDPGPASEIHRRRSRPRCRCPVARRGHLAADVYVDIFFLQNVGNGRRKHHPPEPIGAVRARQPRPRCRSNRRFAQTQGRYSCRREQSDAGAETPPPSPNYSSSSRRHQDRGSSARMGDLHVDEDFSAVRPWSRLEPCVARRSVHGLGKPCILSGFAASFRRLRVTRARYGLPAPLLLSYRQRFHTGYLDRIPRRDVHVERGRRLQRVFWLACAGVDTGAAKKFTLDHGDSLPCATKTVGEQAPPGRCL